MSNDLPRLGDASGAMSSRFLLLKMTNSFYGHEDYRLTDDLLAELPSIFHWAWAGWRRLQERGRFILPGTSAAMIQELDDLTSPVAAFVRDECTVSQGCWIECGELYTRWCQWCESEGRVHPGTKMTLGRDLFAVLPTLARIRKEGPTGERFYAYAGIQ